MFSFCRSAMAISLVLGVMLPIQARAIDLNGAWATDPALCALVYTKKQGHVNFSELSDIYGSGFIIDGNKIRGKAAKCTITSRKEDSDAVLLSAACASAIMKLNVQFSLKVIDDNSITRLFPEMQQMKLNYYRCTL
ncbi:MAG: hypothetical protein P4M07_08155 [Xanthobacteraceae bacterium]|nr:hypothetical protein [Xanthobacteraceae bacterium]